MRTTIRNTGNDGGISLGGGVVTSLITMLVSGGSLIGGGLRQVLSYGCVDYCMIHILITVSTRGGHDFHHSVLPFLKKTVPFLNMYLSNRETKGTIPSQQPSQDVMVPNACILSGNFVYMVKNDVG